MLLTGSQISTALSSGIVCIFTSLLFLSGYAIQQKTVRDIHDLVQPKPTPLSDAIESFPLIPERKQHILSAHGSPRINWKRVAYARSVQDFGEICEAVMLFAELTAQKSAAQKVLFYPEEWDDMFTNGHGSSKRLDTTMRLLQRARKAYRVSLVPVKQGYGYRTREDSLGWLSNMLALTVFDKVLYLQPQGLVMDAEILDSLFGAPLNTSITVLDGARSYLSQSLLIQPSLSLSRRPEIAKSNLGGPLLVDALVNIILPTSAMRTLSNGEAVQLDAQTIYESTGYLRFTDSDIAGPHFDLEYGTFAKHQPTDPDLQIIWRNAYDHFRLMRMNYCNLDLQPLDEMAVSQELK